MAGCVTTGSTGGKTASEQANEQAEKATYKPVEYINSSISGPELLVLPGEIKSSDTGFPQKITMDIIADYAELARLQLVSRARMTQIMSLVLLAPDIQEEILYLPRVEGSRDSVAEKMVRPIAAVPDWRKQRVLLRDLKAEP